MTETLVSGDGPLQHFVKRLRTAEDHPRSLSTLLPRSRLSRRLLSVAAAPPARLSRLSEPVRDHDAQARPFSIPGSTRPRRWLDRVAPRRAATVLGRIQRLVLWAPMLAQAVLDSFAEPMRSRFGERADWPTVSVETQLIRHQAGFFLGPHTDLSTKLVVLLIYLAPDETISIWGLPFTGRRNWASPVRTAPTILSRTSSG